MRHDAQFVASGTSVSIRPHSDAARHTLDSLSLDYPLTELSGVFSMDPGLAVEVAQAMLADDLALAGVSILTQRTKGE